MRAILPRSEGDCAPKTSRACSWITGDEPVIGVLGHTPVKRFAPAVIMKFSLMCSPEPPSFAKKY